MGVENGLSFRSRRRLILLEFIYVIISAIIGVRFFFPQVVPVLVRYIPDPLGVILQVVTIFLIISPVLDWVNRPRIRVVLTPQVPQKDYDVTIAQVINDGAKLAEDLSIRVYQGWIEKSNQVEILEKGRLLGTPRRLETSDVKFEFRFSVNPDTQGRDVPKGFEIVWFGEKKEGFRIIEVPHSVQWRYFRTDIIGILVVWRFNGRYESVERRFRIRDAPTQGHPRLEPTND